MRNHIIRLLACCVCLFPLFKVTAYDFIYNNVAYRFNPDSVSVYVTYKSKGSVVNYNSAIITIPETVVYKAHRYKVTAIGDSAFHYSMQLSGIKMSDNVRSIGRAAFWGCGLFTVTLSDSLTTIDDDAFYDCTLLRKITIPASVTHIGEKAFAACNKMSSIDVSSENAVYDSRDNCNAIIETATNTLLSGCSTTVIPSSVTAIGDYAFDHMGGFNLIIIPNSVRSIGNSSFRGIGSLSLALLGDSVESLGDYAFADCPNLKTMRLSKSLNRVGKYAFYNDNGLDLTLSANVEAGPMRFSGGTLNLLADVTALGSIYVAPDSIYSLANTPPECDENTFLSYDAVLHVQPSAVDAYRNDDIWSRFTIVADDAVQPVDSLYFVRDSFVNNSC